MPSLDDKTVADSSTPNRAAWQHPLYHSGLLQGFGLALVLWVIALQLPLEFFSNSQAAAFILGALLLIIGAWRHRQLPM